MMKLKKLFVLALAGVMTLALLTGCGDKPAISRRTPSGPRLWQTS